MPSKDTALMKSLEWVIDIDPAAIAASVAEDRQRNPHASNRQLAENAFSKARWKATATGVATGLPANPWVALPAAMADVAATLKLEAQAAARVALIYDDKFFDREDAAWELLVPIFGLNAGSQTFREIGIRGGVGVTRSTIKRYLTKDTLKAFQRLMIKYFGLKVTQKGLITKTLPIVGGLIGGTWNYVEVTSIRKRTINYFECAPA